MNRWWIGPLLALFVAIGPGCSRSGVLQAPESPVRSDQVTDFATLYGLHCAGCHGADGQFGPAPPLNDPLFLAIVPDPVLLRLVADGRPGTPMPGFSRKKGGTLTDEQVKAIAGGIKARWKPAPEVPPPGYLASDGHGHGEGVAEAGRGRRLFDRACASCHGPDGLGGKDKVGPINDPAFLALISDQAIRRTIITGRRDLKMPDFAGKEGRPDDFRPLSPTDVDDLVGFVSSWRGKQVADRPVARRLDEQTAGSSEDSLMENATGPTASTAEHPSRREMFFRWATYGLGGLASAVVSLPLIGYILGPKKEPERWVGLGRSEDFEVGETRLVTFDNPIRQPWDGVTAMTGVYVRRQPEENRDKGKFLIFAVNCAHLGCPVEWFPQSGLFMCPCHGGVYHADGERASGPPPRGLFQCEWRERGGHLELRAPHYPTLQDTEKQTA